MLIMQSIDSRTIIISLKELALVILYDETRRHASAGSCSRVLKPDLLKSDAEIVGGRFVVVHHEGDRLDGPRSFHNELFDAFDHLGDGLGDILFHDSEHHAHPNGGQRDGFAAGVICGFEAGMDNLAQFALEVVHHEDDILKAVPGAVWPFGDDRLTIGERHCGRSLFMEGITGNTHNSAVDAPKPRSAGIDGGYKSRTRNARNVT